MAPKAEFTDITPAMAELLLTKNTHNRPVVRQTVEEYKRDMLADQWDSNGETIKIALDGTVIDGQHRLTAIAESGVTLENVLLVTGLPLSVQKTVDGGRKRTMGQDLKIAGVVNFNTVAAISLRGWMWDNGNTKFSNAVRPTRRDLDKYFTDNASAINRSAQIGTQTRTAFRPAVPSAVGTAHYLTSRVNVGDAAEFFAQLGNGTGLNAGDPILALRTRMTNDFAMGVKSTDMIRTGIILRAWNAVRNGEKLAKIQFTSDSKMPEPK